MWGVFSQRNTYAKSVKEIKELRTLRRQYQSDLQYLKSADLTFNFVVAKERKYKRQYAKLLPMELSTLEKHLASAKTTAADRSLLYQAQNITASPPTGINGLSQLARFTTDYSQLFSNASLTVRERVTTQLEAHTTEALRVAINQEMEGLSSTTVSGLNDLYQRLGNKYPSFSRHPMVQNAKDRILSAKEIKVRGERFTLTRRITEAATEVELKKIDAEYLFLLRNTSDSTVSTLRTKLERRREAIRRSTQLRVAREEKERELAEARVLQAAGFANFRIDNLYHSKLVDNIFRGNFVDIPFNRDELEFASLLESYMDVRSRNCKTPATNRVQIMEDVCATERVTRNGWGVETNRQCVEWVE
ncbi:MAG: hypothetical protein AAFN92_19645, partial [Bacteroidota bacterium]